MRIQKHNLQCEDSKISNHIKIQSSNPGSYDTTLAVHEVHVNSKGNFKHKQYSMGDKYQCIDFLIVLTFNVIFIFIKQL